MKGFHHFYIGIALCLISFFAIWTKFYVVSCPVLALGFWLVADDIYQHNRQLKDPEYRSFLHRFYGKYLYKIGWIRKLNRLADRVCHG